MSLKYVHAKRQYIRVYSIFIFLLRAANFPRTSFLVKPIIKPFSQYKVLKHFLKCTTVKDSVARKQNQQVFLERE